MRSVEGQEENFNMKIIIAITLRRRRFAACFLFFFVFS